MIETVSKLVESATIQTNITLVVLLDVDQSHPDHGLREVEEEGSLIHGVSVHQCSRSRARHQCLVRRQQSCSRLQHREIRIVEYSLGGVERHDGIVVHVIASARLYARPLQGRQELTVYGWVHVVRGIEVAQPVFE